MKLSRLTQLASALMLCLAVGCGGSSSGLTSKVKGTITLDGVTLQAGTINFASPTTGDAAIAQVTDGKFVVGRMAPGVYKVVVTPPTPTPDNPVTPESKIPAKYRAPETSDLTSTIKGGTIEVNFDLKS